MKKIWSLAAAVALITAGCGEADVTPPEAEASPDLLTAALAGGPLPRPMTWADGELFAGLVTPATFKPSSGNFDELYNCGAGGGFKDGVPLISESKPGDQDYNGGRWHLNLPINPAVCAAKYSDADRVEDLDLADFMSTDAYFECPLLPRRGGN